MLYLPCLAGSTQDAWSERRRSQGRRKGRHGGAAPEPELPAAVRQRGGGGGAGQGQCPGANPGLSVGEVRRRWYQPRSVSRGGSRVLHGGGEEEVVPTKVSIQR